MYLNLFSVRIPEGNEVPGGYVEMTHGSTYTLVLRNSRVTRCDAQVYIDGKHVGTWRIPAQASIRLERPAHDTGHFTFYSIDSDEFEQAALNMVDRSQLGLVKVIFTPEVYPTTRVKDLTDIYTTNVIWDYTDSNTTTSGTYTTYASGGGGTSSRAYSAGGTGLSGTSSQSFLPADNIRLDLSQQTVIHLRLVEKRDDAPRPLTQFSTPVPPPM